MRARAIAIALSLLPTVLCAQMATIVESNTEFEYTGARSAVCREHRVIRVNNEHGAEAAIFSCMCSENISLGKFSGTVVDASGKVLVKIKKGDLIRSEYSSELISDQYGYFYGYESHSYPYTVTYDWEERFDNGIHVLPMFVPQPAYDVDAVYARYRIVGAEENAYRCHAMNFTPEWRNTQIGGKTAREVTVEHLPAVPHYSYGLPLREQTPLMYVAPTSFVMHGTRCDLTDWQSFGLWVNGLLKGRDKIPQPLAERLAAVTDTCTTTHSRIEAVRRMIGQTTRYVSIQGGLNGYQSMSVEEVYKKGLGDCKALANYLCSALRHLGIPAEYALISTQRKRLMDMPSLQELNHVIAMIPLPGDTLWVECTNPNYPYDHLPADLCDHDVVVIRDEGGVLMHTPALPDDHNTDHSVYSIELTPQGHAQMHLDEYLKGQFFDQYLALTTLQPTEQRKRMLGQLNIAKAQISDLQLAHQEDVMHLSMDFSADAYAKVTGNRLFVPVCPVVLSGLRNAKEPAHDISLEDSGGVITDEVQITLPEGSSVEHLPEAREMTSAFGSCSIEAVEAEPGKVKVSVRVQINSGHYPAQQYEDWVAFRKSIASLANNKMVIKM